MEEKYSSTECPACGTLVQADDLKCHECGYGLMGDPMPFKVGTILEGRYRIDAEVDRGGMGVVYKGIDLTLSRPVAIKAMLESRADAGAKSCNSSCRTQCDGTKSASGCYSIECERS